MFNVILIQISVGNFGSTQVDFNVKNIRRGKKQIMQNNSVLSTLIMYKIDYKATMIKKILALAHLKNKQISGTQERIKK